MEEAREKKYLEIPLTKILLSCIYILFSHDKITLEEIQQKLNSPETLKISRDFGASASVI